jgi:hypothetical protein
MHNLFSDPELYPYTMYSNRKLPYHSEFMVVTGVLHGRQTRHRSANGNSI